MESGGDVAVDQKHNLVQWSVSQEVKSQSGTWRQTGPAGTVLRRSPTQGLSFKSSGYPLPVGQQWQDRGEGLPGLGVLV